MDEAVQLFESVLPDPRTTNLPAMSDHFIVNEEDVILTAQRAKSSIGYKWRIEYPI